MIILGIHEGHDSSAALIKDGEIIADVQEERFSRVKHTSNTPIHSIEFCLKQAGLSSIDQVDKVSLSWSYIPRGTKALFGIKKEESTKKKLVKKVAESFFNMNVSKDRLKLPIYYKNYSSFDSDNIINNDHHLTHAASAYFTQSDNDKHLVFTIDGAGDGTCTAIWLAEKNKIKLLKKYYKEASIGWAYSVVTEGLHWIHGDGEGKTMGLAPYGNYENCMGELDKYFPEFKNDKLIKPSNLGNEYYWTERGSNQFHFDEAKEIEELVEKYNREDIAAEAQRKLEEVVLNIVKGWVKKTGIKKVCFAGGVMLNVKLNQRIWNNRKEIGITKQHIFPNPGDSGLAVGAALLEYYRQQ